MRAVAKSDPTLITSLLELLDAKQVVPNKLISAAIDMLLRHVYKTDGVVVWCQVLSGTSERLPRRLLDSAGADFFAQQQIASIMAFTLDFFKASDKLGALLKLFLELNKHLDDLKDDTFRGEVRILCDMAAIDKVEESDVENIQAKMQELCNGGPNASRFQKALAFFPSGIALCARVDTEVRCIKEMQGLDMDLEELERSFKAWPANGINLQHAGRAVSTQVIFGHLDVQPKHFS